MKRIHLAPTSLLRLTTATFLMVWLTPSGLAQSSKLGMVDDWTHHHVIFSDPGTRDEAIRNGKFQEWQRIVNHPRYRMQRYRQSLSVAGQTTTTVGLPRAPEAAPFSSPRSEIANFSRQRSQESSLHADWTVGLGGDVAAGVYPAKYTLDVNAALDCTGHMYFCGNATTSAIPTVWRVGFNNSGQMNPTNDGNNRPLASQAGGLGDNACTPLTEVFNPSIGDLLFVGMTAHGAGDCGGSPCVMSFDITIASNFPTSGQKSTFTTTGNAGFGGIIVDNISGGEPASNIYFGTLQSNHTGVQLLQSALE
jgi:hypothetical protein